MVYLKNIENNEFFFFIELSKKSVKFFFFSKLQIHFSVNLKQLIYIYVFQIVGNGFTMMCFLVCFFKSVYMSSRAEVITKTADLIMAA